MNPSFSTLREGFRSFGRSHAPSSSTTPAATGSSSFSTKTFAPARNHYYGNLSFNTPVDVNSSNGSLALSTVPMNASVPVCSSQVMASSPVVYPISYQQPIFVPYTYIYQSAFPIYSVQPQQPWQPYALSGPCYDHPNAAHPKSSYRNSRRRNSVYFSTKSSCVMRSDLYQNEHFTKPFYQFGHSHGCYDSNEVNDTSTEASSEEFSQAFEVLSIKSSATNCEENVHVNEIGRLAGKESVPRHVSMPESSNIRRRRPNGSVQSNARVFFPTSSFSSSSSNSMTSENSGKLEVQMNFSELHAGILRHLERHQSCRISWLNRLLAKSSTLSEFDQACRVFEKFQRLPSLSPASGNGETGTLMIKAACRAGVPERALFYLRNVDHVRLWPTLGGLHYLMISFSLRHDTRAVLETFELTKLRQLRPTIRTFHILIRECVDHALIEEALQFAEEARSLSIVPNRVTYNILMNGCRKSNRPQQMLRLRAEMDQHHVELNETTVKFTVVAHLMLGQMQNAVTEFLSYAQSEQKMIDFVEKLFEVSEEESEIPKEIDEQIHPQEHPETDPISILSPSPSSSSDPSSLQSSLAAENPSVSSPVSHQSQLERHQRKLVIELFDELRKRQVVLSEAVEKKLHQLSSMLMEQSPTNADTPNLVTMETSYSTTGDNSNHGSEVNILSNNSTAQ